MANRSILRFIMVGAMILLPFTQVRATDYKWGSDTGALGTNGHSFDFLTDVGATVGDTGGRIELVDGDVLNLDGTITISGDVVISATTGECACVTVTVGGFIMQDLANVSAQRGYVLGRPYNPDFADEAKGNPLWSQLAFNVSGNNQIKIECADFPMAFTDHFNEDNDGRPNIPLKISVFGQGQVLVRLKDGCCIVFRGQVPDGSDDNLLNPAGIEFTDCGCVPTMGDPGYDQSITNSGVHVCVVMDQTEAQRNNGENKLVFSRYQYEVDGGNPKEGQPSEVWVGEHAYLTYISTNHTGLAANGADAFGSIGFDASSEENSRLALRIFGAPGQPGADGAVVVCGHRMADNVAMGLQPEAAARFVELNHMAGREAAFRIVDELAFASKSAYACDASMRRGLLVINGNKTIPFFASNPYSIDRENPTMDGPFGNDFFRQGQLGQIRNGFVVGVNGHVKVFQNTFLDYVAAAANKCYPTAETCFGYPFNGDLTDITKKHNPSALIIDGLTVGLNANNANMPYQDPFTPKHSLGVNAVDFTAFSDPDVCQHAKITLCGDGCIFFRAAKSAREEEPADVFAYSCEGDCVYSFTIGSGCYEVSTDPNCPAFSVPALNPGYDPIMMENVLEDFGDAKLGEGDHVLDVEGRVTVCSVDDDFMLPPQPGKFVRHMGTQKSKAGSINMASLLLDHKGVEIGIDLATGNKVEITRPLTVTCDFDEPEGTLYPRNQSPTMFFNAPVDYPKCGVPSASFFCVDIEHNDVSKAFNIPDPIIGEPGITGGSRAVWDDRFNLVMPELPLIRFVNTDLLLHENLIASGIRFEVTEAAEDCDGNAQFSTDADNCSSIVSFNKGDALDTRAGHGRLFMLGTQQNVMCDGYVYQSKPGMAAFDTFYRTPFPLISAFVNVYRRTTTPASELPTDVIKLSLRTAPEFPSGLSPEQEAKQIAEHLIFMANKSHIALGWTSLLGDAKSHPWFNLTDDELVGPTFDITGEAMFDAGPVDMTKGTLCVENEFYWFGGIDGHGPCVEDIFGLKRTKGNQVIKPVVTPFDPRAVYANHGGLFKVNPDVDVYFDTTLARRLSTAGDEFAGCIDAPNDQIKFSNQHGIQPYALDFTDGPIHLDVFNEDHVGGPPNDKVTGEVVVIPWLYRQDSTSFLPVKRSACKTKVRSSIKDLMLRQAKSGHVVTRSMTRSTPDLSTPVTLPDCLLFMTTGDEVEKMIVGGATAADPFHLHVTGSADGFARVREFETLKMDLRCELVMPVYGDGDFAALFLSQGGRIGLGSRCCNPCTWNTLGWDHVTIFAHGNGVVDVNSDLVVKDKLPLIATTEFGSSTTNPPTGEPHRIEFYSEDFRVVRIPAGHELDLCTFGRGNLLNGQQIAFGGNIRLIFEPGSILRFPDGSVVDGAAGNSPILLMKDAAVLQFEGNKDRDEGRKADITESDGTRCKIMGKGQIWLNDDANLQIFDTAVVAIEADEKTPNTDITISIQRQGQMLIGSQNESGGAFQVGNFDDRDGTSINFLLRIDGPKALFRLERQGFFGLGVGVFNKQGNMNGAAAVNTTDPTTGWQIQTLFNVNNVEIRNIRGNFDHSNIFDGSDLRASLMAIGPLGGTYTVRLGTTDLAMILGGGNLLFLRSATITPLTVGIWSFADPLVGGTVDNGKYTLLASTEVLRQRRIGPLSDALVDSSTFVGSGSTVAEGLPIEGNAIGDSYTFVGAAGNMDDMYTFLSFPNYHFMFPGKFVALGETQFEELAGFINNGVGITSASSADGSLYSALANIIRVEEPVAFDQAGQRSDIRQNLWRGVLGGAGNSLSNGPSRFVVLSQ